ncbi:hypothetical protein LPTSP4_02490 [Leptospira ryugenii]|uniref:Uncharacterized protein n=1 Tax=Leptospira ryugenii TaxID=1917863 RepID=A0A2P2DVT2_9LEPT|nr:hypothetical protein [Leptospira ryugenii]GBF48749.1 hypothetical protein LPTSP4_02490 [Leptospira ryugenii]
MKEALKRPHLAHLSSLFLFVVVSLSGETATSSKEKSLDKEILFLYNELARHRDLLSVQTVSNLPSNTVFTFLGKYPNRQGFTLKKFFIDTDPNHKGRVKTSEEKSITLEFTGNTLSKVEIRIISEDTQIQQKTKTILIENTPLDEETNDLKILFSSIEGEEQMLLSDLTNDSFKSERTDFKRDFYIKILQDFQSQLYSIRLLQKEQSSKKQNRIFKQLDGSLKY